ncbi:hypothetical protein OCT59_019991 [Rhizophagus irregularis]|nr:hypothetical protein OCT59_019991 [Rhizophagus irregularis]
MSSQSNQLDMKN